MMNKNAPKVSPVSSPRPYFAVVLLPHSAGRTGTSARRGRAGRGSAGGGGDDGRRVVDAAADGLFGPVLGRAANK